MSNPYREKPDHCFWSRSVSWLHHSKIDPVVGDIAMLTPDDKVATMGSCFAQHLSRHLQRAGLTYFVAETADPEMPPEAAAELGYGVFSARYGNVYTVRQAVQLFDRAFGRFHPEEDVRRFRDAYVDAFRPRIQPGGFASVEAARSAAADHLACVRRVFSEADYLVFTLGLTEGWRSKIDGAIYPLAPGVAGGSFDAQRHEPVNFSIFETIDDLTELSRRLFEVNPGLRVILTVSPVPLIATHDDRHVLEATVYSKSVLRVAAAELARRFPQIVYFPSYEIITGPAGAGIYYGSDLREVTEAGVEHVMRVFSDHFVAGGQHRRETARAAVSGQVAPNDSGMVCDEEEIERAIAMAR